MTWVILGAVLAVAAVVLVALPFLREPQAADDRLDAVSPEEVHRIRLVEERDRALAALKELEFDHRTGKISDEDYRELLVPLRREAAAALKALDNERLEAIDREARYGAQMEPLPTLPPEPAPPPDEGTPPTPAPIPEPYPPPDEATPPAPDPVPSQE